MSAPRSSLRRGAVVPVLVLALALVSAPHAWGQAVELEPVVSASAPIGLVHAGDARLFVVERAGRVRILDPGGGLQPQNDPYLSVTVSQSGEGGLLSIAFHPDYDQNGFVFVSYTAAGPFRNVLARFTVDSSDPDHVDPTSFKVLLEEIQPASNHNGGQLQFGPDGYLYMSIGDGGGAGDLQCNAQRDDNRLGTLLRIDVDQSVDAPPYYGIPSDNPFTGAPGGPAAEVWAKGLRNPWRFSFDRTRGDLWIGDVGQDAVEEIDFQPAGAAGGRNYGWKVMEGNSCFDPDPIDADCPVATPSCNSPAYTDPIFDYAHGPGICGNPGGSVTGGYVYRGDGIPSLRGDYVFADYCQGKIWALRRNGMNATRRELLSASAIVSFGEGPDGELYVMRGSDVNRLAPVGGLGFDARCPRALIQAFRQGSRVAGAEALRCLSLEARGRLETSLDECVDGDPRGRVARALERSERIEAKRCAAAPPFGPESAESASEASAGLAGELMRDGLGQDLDAAAAERASERDRARCQASVSAALRGCQDAQVDAFWRCGNRGLARGEIGEAADLAACLDSAADPRVARRCDPASSLLQRRIEATCARRGVDLSDAFPGCNEDDAAALAACLSRAARCRVCRALETSGTLGADCDALDDGATNASCASP